jgi:hypothetical protein
VAIRVCPIGHGDIPAVAQFLHEEMNSRVSPDSWARAVDTPWKPDPPNHGFALYEDSRIVGVYLGIYADREIRNRVERFCNLAAWCVLPTHRFHALRLLRALLAQDGYHFTDLSPSGSVVGLNRRLGFEFLDTTAAIMPNLPWPVVSGVKVIADRQAIERTLTGADLEIFQHHAQAAAARHVVLRDGPEWCYVIFRKDRRKNLPLFASILYASNPTLLRRGWPALSRHLLRHGALATLAELRVVGARPPLSLLVAAPRRKMFRSRTLAPDDIDNLYSELVSVAW